MCPDYKDIGRIAKYTYREIVQVGTRKTQQKENAWMNDYFGYV